MYNLQIKIKIVFVNACLLANLQSDSYQIKTHELMVIEFRPSLKIGTCIQDYKEKRRNIFNTMINLYRVRTYMYLLPI